MDPIILGVLAMFLIVGIAGMFIYSSLSGSVSVLKVIGVGAGSGFLGSIIGVFTDAWQFIIASAYGHLGLYGWLLVIGLVLCLGVWTWNAVDDARRNRPISFVE